MRFSFTDILYVYKVPIWAKVFYFSILLMFSYASLTRSSKLVELWGAGALAQFIMLFSFGSLIFLAYAITRLLTVFTQEMIYERTWRGTKEIAYRDIVEIYYSKTGSLHLILKDSSRVEAWVHPSKLIDVIKAIELSGCSPRLQAERA